MGAKSFRFFTLWHRHLPEFGVSNCGKKYCTALGSSITRRESKSGANWEATKLAGNFCNLSANVWKKCALSENVFTGKLVRKFSTLTKSLSWMNGWVNSSSKGDLVIAAAASSSLGICVRMDSMNVPVQMKKTCIRLRMLCGWQGVHLRQL